jgi:hypothetical protein
MGVTIGESEAEYFASGCLGSTSLNCYVLDGPEAFYQRHVKQNPYWTKETTDEMRAGKLIHAMVEMQGEVGDRALIADPKYTTASGALSGSKEAKAWIAMQDPGQIICTASEYEDAEFVYDRILANPVAREILEGAQHEVSMRVKDPLTGMYVQTRVDVLQPWCRADIKKLGKPMSRFRYSFREYGMGLQAALYDLVDKALTKVERPHLWIVAQDVYPYEVKVFQATESQLAAGAAAMNEAMDGIALGKWGEPQAEPVMLEEV